MESFVASATLVAFAEIGDKTQLLSLCLAARFRRTTPILAGIALATIAHHGLAGAAGAWVSDILPAHVLRFAVGASFLLLAAWALRSDAVDGLDAAPGSGHGAFLASLGSFFLAEMGDKTQLATVALTARFDALAPVVFGSVVGMMAVAVPTVLFGSLAAERLPLRPIRLLAAALFGALGVAALLSGAVG
jgi:putative Ca2+/H+ antiporter (TMEM165/GDT1 family)